MGIVLAAVLKVGYILICKVIMVIIFVVLAIQYWVGEDIRKAEEEKRGTWLFTLEFIGLTVLTMLAANIPGQVQQDAGLRGFQVGGAQVSEKHCGFVINKDQATASDVMNLMNQVSDKVYEEFGVRLQPEVKRLGEF